jgi:hypothetical protein
MQTSNALKKFLARDTRNRRADVTLLEPRLFCITVAMAKGWLLKVSKSRCASNTTSRNDENSIFAAYFF